MRESRGSPLWLRTYRSLVTAVDSAAHGLRRGVTWLLPPYGVSRSTDRWERVWLARTEARWRRGSEVVECFRFGDGYVATVEYTNRAIRWQLTPGPVSLASALFTVALYIQYDITPQIDPEGRMFVALADDGPRQVFSESPEEPVRYVYIDSVRTLEELPDCLDTTSLERAYSRLSYNQRRQLRSGRS